MPYIVYIQTSIVPILMLLAIFANSRGSMANKRLRLFSQCIALIIAVLAFDLLAWALDGSQFKGASQFLLVINTLPYLLGVLISFVWLCYTYAVLIGDKPRSAAGFALSVAPVVLFCVFALVNLGTGLLFFIDDTGTYVRGPLFFVYIVITFGYLIAAAILSLAYAAKSPTKSRRNECLVLASFVVLPIIGAIVQVLGYGLSLVWPLASVSVLIVYLGQVNQSVSLDALTGLNNRGQLDKLLLARCGEAERSVPIYLVIMDVNGFKGINDTKGHVVGDKALEYIADALKKAFDNTDAFLARYGGDEFAVVVEAASSYELLSALSVFKQTLETQSQSVFGTVLTVSSGIAEYDVGCNNGVEWFIASADSKMYEQKQGYCQKHSGD